MKIRSSPLFALVAGSACALCTGIGIAQGNVEQRASQMKIYAIGEIDPHRYEVVGRPWVDSWRSAFWVPTFPTEEQALAALRTEAAHRGADGLLNVSCRDQGRSSWSSSTEPAFLCYAVAIRLRPS